ncbi:TIM44-like domain-containing protein [Achromobacter insolitus]|jgi:predicted lipid-binding transport protein (Tim44 family)|uniref:Tim44 domain-containing protein n=1 Tax=Achromobacter TaxID=222 RepID=UPI0007C3EB5D|nr:MULTISPECIES: TIM44-like domain-containing protein [Achromobacter]APX78312.1 transport protein [Achromobacter insolitus]AXA74226.1 transport protein [Achromobacter insolitus]MCP1400847.1 putative lipid-binding transport protein (Tim44 family) [Achromobacter insolitus]MDH3062157.1 TIM44-like domain-containing protein [Achromobacter insolitus]MEB3095255.1 TIM44-like domain-containing protein [Achromobacter sp. D10]
MSKFCLSRFVAAALIAVSGAALVTASFDAEARRAGGGSSVGRQSSNVTQQRQATTPPAAANNTAGATAAPAAAGAATAGAATAGAAAKSGASRWLGPIAGIAAGLGIAALLSSMGLSGAFAEFLSSALLIGLVVFAIMFIVRRLRGAGPRTATQGAFGGNNASGQQQQQQPMWRESLKPAPAAPAAAPVAAAAAAPAALPKMGDDNNWFVPGDFDTPNFLKQAKEQFVRIQAVWDSGSTEGLREFLTDDLITELKPQLAERGAAPNKTEVVLLNAEMLGIETVSDGHLASVRFSGMLREAPGTEAFRFEEVWNLFKPANGGWLLAGIQQIPVDLAS